jgi:GDP-mannose 6-dehydrogenase
MKISIFGIGYVGCVSAACFAHAGHDVTGVDVNPTKVDIINSGKSPIVEPQMNELIHDVVKSGKLRATTDSMEAVKSSDVSLVCVGTPSKSNGSLDLGHVARVCEEIGAALATKDTHHTIVIRSTMLPGSIESVAQPALEKTSRKKAGKDFGLCVNPEFLREGTSVKDFYAPPFTLIGADDEETAQIVSGLYSNIDAPIFNTTIKTAEMVKYVCNCFHALKVSFANEIGNICKALELDSHEVMKVFCADTKLNLSPYYLKPGFAFGGSCLPKDLRAVSYKAKELDVEVPLLSAITATNKLQVEKALDMVLNTGNKQVGVLGFSFKAGTDDLRESPMVTLIETLLGKGLELVIYDRDVSQARLIGSNKANIEEDNPHNAKQNRGSIDEV